MFENTRKVLDKFESVYNNCICKYHSDITKDEEDVKLYGIIVPNYEEIKKLWNKEELDKEEVQKLENM